MVTTRLGSTLGSVGLSLKIEARVSGGTGDGLGEGAAGRGAVTPVPWPPVPTPGLPQSPLQAKYAAPAPTDTPTIARTQSRATLRRRWLYAFKRRAAAPGAPA